MHAITLKKAKRGEFVRRNPDAKQTYVRSEYDHTTKSFALVDFDDVNRVIYVKATATVYIGFDF